MDYDTALIGVISHSIGKLGACKCLQVNREDTTQKNFKEIVYNLRKMCII